MLSKTCTKCGETYPATTEHFPRSSKSRDGLHSWCKACIAAHARAWRTTHKQKVAAYNSVYRNAHKEEAAAASRLRGQTHKERIALVSRMWHQRNKERTAAYVRQRCRANPVLRLSKAISLGMWASLRARKAGRHWEGLVGYTLAELMHHLEAQFQPGMTWENYGREGWTIDHVKPQAAFHYQSPDDPGFRECWALSNLQPLWAADNFRKHAHWEGMVMHDADSLQSLT